MLLELHVDHHACCIPELNWPFLTNIISFLFIQRNVIAILGKMTGAGIVIMTFCCALCIVEGGITCWLMMVVQLQSIKLVGCHQGNQTNCAIKQRFNEN